MIVKVRVARRMIGKVGITKLAAHSALVTCYPPVVIGSALREGQ